MKQEERKSLASFLFPSLGHDTAIHSYSTSHGSVQFVAKAGSSLPLHDRVPQWPPMSSQGTNAKGFLMNVM